MCGRFTLATPPEIVAEFFELTSVPDLAPRYNVAPTQDVPAVIVTPDQPGRQLALFRWGLIPAGADDPAVGNRMINARAETVAVRPAFRSAFRMRRCLVISDGFYEWQNTGERRKQPFHIRMCDGSPFAYAGLWDCWQRGEAPIRSCTIITCPPNELVAPLHDRMPVIIDRRDFGLWLDPSITSPKMLSPLLKPYPAAMLAAHPVSTRVNSATIDDPSCIEPLSDNSGMPGLF